MLYVLTAFALSFAWLGALAFTPGFDMAISGYTEEIFSLPRQFIWALFPIISVSIAVTFKRWILSCRGWKMLLPAAALPWIGIFIIAVVCGIAGRTLHHDPIPNEAFFGVFFYGVSFTGLGFWVAFPLGLLSQISLLGADRVAGIEKTEQGFAPQSAIRSESDSEGGVSPQPESKPRPR